MSKRYECWIVEADFFYKNDWLPYDGMLLNGAYASKEEAQSAIDNKAPLTARHWLRVRKYVEAA